ncbi:MAG: hypothetical protein K2O05_02550 [Anaeroplasmataceae bacterium]|nr:hypothetical protein [Anaeroplasmataceae bacterium]MDE7100714.1 hypothetical protein [Anaeroplasmataceae bacterium]
MKKIWLLIGLIFIMGISSCKSKTPKEVDIYLPDGTPALAMANILDEGFTYESTKTNFHIVPAGNIAQEVSADTCDLAIMPVTAAATLYNKGIEIRLVSVNVFGNLHIVGTNELDSLEELKGQIVYTTTGTTIAMVKYLLSNSNISFGEGEEKEDGKVMLCSKNDASEIIPLLSKAAKDGVQAYGVLGEPVVTKALALPANLKLTFDLQKIYKDLKQTDGYPQAGLVVKKSFAEEHPDYVAALLDKLEENNAYLLAHTEQLPKVFEKYDSSLKGMTFTQDTISRCNVEAKRAKTIENDILGYVKELAKLDLTSDFIY